MRTTAPPIVSTHPRRPWHRPQTTALRISHVSRTLSTIQLLINSDHMKIDSEFMQRMKMLPLPMPDFDNPFTHVRVCLVLKRPVLLASQHVKLY